MKTAALIKWRATLTLRRSLLGAAGVLKISFFKNMSQGSATQTTKMHKEKVKANVTSARHGPCVFNVLLPSEERKDFCMKKDYTIHVEKKEVFLAILKSFYYRFFLH